MCCYKRRNIPQAFSSDPSLQSLFPSQKRPLSMQMESPHASFPISQRGSSVLSRGWTFLSLVSLSQFFTAHFQSQVCFSRSKARPGGHRMACRPYSSFIKSLSWNHRCPYPCSALDDISARVFAGLQSKQFARALSSAEFLLLSQFLITLAKNSWNTFMKSIIVLDRNDQMWLELVRQTSRQRWGLRPQSRSLPWLRKSSSVPSCQFDLLPRSGHAQYGAALGARRRHQLSPGRSPRPFWWWPAWGEILPTATHPTFPEGGLEPTLSAG